MKAGSCIARALSKDVCQNCKPIHGMISLLAVEGSLGVDLPNYKIA